MFTESDGTVTDETLMHAVRKGDVAKLGLLFERHHRPLFDFLARLTSQLASRSTRAGARRLSRSRSGPLDGSATSRCARVSFPWNIRLSWTIRATGVAQSFHESPIVHAHGALVSYGTGDARPEARPAPPAMTARIRVHPATGTTVTQLLTAFDNQYP